MAAVAHQQVATVHQHVVVEDELDTEIEKTIDDIEGQLYSIMVRFRRIVRSARKIRDDESFDCRKDDLQQLKDMYDELQEVETKHPHCTGCNPTFQPNQMAHMGGCIDADDDNTDIEKALSELLKK
jgi:hypothetical protein